MIKSARYTRRSERLADTFLGRIYRRLYVHPICFYGDLQHEGIVNWHRKIRDFVQSFSSNDRLLDLGSGSRRIGQNVLALDIKFFPSLDIVADAHNLPFKNGCFDGIILQMVLEHIAEPQRVLEEVARVLKPGGRLYCEVPFLFPVHDRSDYRRWTLRGLIDSCAAFEIIEWGSSMGPFSALSALLRRLITLYATSLYLEATLDLLLGWLLWPIRNLDRLLPPPCDTEIVAGAIYLIGRKPSYAK